LFNKSTSSVGYPNLPHNLTLIVDSYIGINNISIFMNGTIPDGSGFGIMSIGLYSLEQISQNHKILDQNLEIIFNNSLMNSFVQVPGYRIIWSQFIMLFVNFDRL